MQDNSRNTSDSINDRAEGTPISETSNSEKYDPIHSTEMFGLELRSKPNGSDRYYTMRETCL